MSQLGGSTDEMLKRSTMAANGILDHRSKQKSSRLTDHDQEQAEPGEDGSWDVSESQRTVVEDDFFADRHPDLAGDPALRRIVLGWKRQQHLLTPQSTLQRLTGYRPRLFSTNVVPFPSPPDSGSQDSFVMAEASQPLTQQATQPYENHRRLGRHLSDISEDDAADVICLLSPSTPAAFEACQATMLHAPEHILQNHDLDSITDDDLLFKQNLQQSREFALRMSSTVKRPADGFRFGRNPASCDVLLTPHSHDKLISNTHFKIFVNSQGSLMLQDMSTNGTIVDDEHLRRRGHQSDLQPMRALKNGSIICVLSEPGKQEIKLMVRIPNRGDIEEVYERKLKQYLEQRGKVAAFASMRESPFGNHWNGGMLYNFTGMLGKGAFAQVYRIQTKREGTIYAAKELDKRRFIKNGILDTKFDSELKIMKDLKHPNIVQYIDCQMHQHWIYIIMEFIACGELSKELQDRKSIPEVEVKQIAKQIMRALDYLHRRNITHRDIKPDNILIASRDPLVVKLSDFGLSKCINDQETFLKTFCGTLLYCAPEVYPDYNNYTHGPYKRRRRGEPASRTSPYDQSVDMWSFGAVLFHILCGKPPIMGKGDDRGAQMLSNIMTQEVDFTPLRLQKVSEAGIDFIARLLNRNPFLRPKEKECLEHPWLQDVPDLFDYSEHDQIPDYVIRRELEAVEELDEDPIDEELMRLHEMTQPPPSSDHGLQSTPDEPPVKRPRTVADSDTIPDQITYPLLPESSHTVPAVGNAAAGPRLFGEISPSLLESSGVFGHQPASPVGTRDVHDIRQGLQEVSVNDYGISNNQTDASGPRPQQEAGTGLPTGQTLFAPSLLGAEAQIQQLNMASPDPAPSDVATPDTTHPITPRTREISPSSSISRSADYEPPAAENDVKFSRKIDVTLLNDPQAFAASLQAREASRAKKLQHKAETFHVQPPTATRRYSTELAATVDARTGVDGAVAKSMPRAIPFSRTINITADRLNRSSPRFGKLVPVPGSCGEPRAIVLERRLTSWGRGADCHIRHHDPKDTRIPKYAIKITFWANGIEKHVEKGGDWTQVPGIRTLISTSTSQQIWINDIELRKESSDGRSALYGQIYSGDIITVHEGGNPHEFLKYRVEIMFGDSARPRPEKELPFVIQHEFDHHRQKKERDSMRDSGSDHGREERAVTTPVVVQ